MRFIIEFFLFGFLFFLLWHFFPEAFATLVSWAQAVYDFFANLFAQVGNRVQSEHPTVPPPPAKTLLPLLIMMLKR